MARKVFVFDLDDTLTKEIDFLKSGYHAVSELVSKRFGLDAGKVYRELYDWYRAGENTFACLNESYGLDNPIGDYLNVYRFHTPDIHLAQDVIDALNVLRDAGIELGIVSDGRDITQKNKFDALGLAEWFDESCFLINSNQQLFKPNPYGYERLMLAMYKKTGASDLEFTYIADNPEKDFLWPNSHGWSTVCLLDDGRNIHKQNFNLPQEYLPMEKIKQLGKLI